MDELVERVDERDRVVGVVKRDAAIRNRWLHRIATVTCQDPDGRFLVHRRPENSSRFPGQYNWMVGGAADVGETYGDAAAREVAEELGVRVPVRFSLKFLCQGAISPYWIALHAAVIPCRITPDPSEIAWHGWLTEAELVKSVDNWPFVPDSREALAHYLDFRN